MPLAVCAAGPWRVDSSWARSAGEYLRIYANVTGQPWPPQAGGSAPFEQAPAEEVTEVPAQEAPVEAAPVEEVPAAPGCGDRSCGGYLCCGDRSCGCSSKTEVQWGQRVASMAIFSLQ